MCPSSIATMSVEVRVAVLVVVPVARVFPVPPLLLAHQRTGMFAFGTALV